MIPRQLAQRFSPSTRVRGERYSAEGRVRFAPAAQGNEIHATVQGSELYYVVVELGRQHGWDFECNCPFALDNYYCKHIWAVLLSADAQGMLPGGPGRPGRSQTMRQAEWLRRLKSAARHTCEVATPASWPDDRRIVYYLDLDHLRQSDDPIIEVKTRRLRKAAPNIPFEFSLDAWLKAPDAGDREVAQLLNSARPEHSDAFDPSYDKRFLIPPGAYERTLRAICETGRLQLRSGGQTGRQAVRWDGDMPWTVSFRLTKERKNWQLAAEFVRAEEVKPVNTALLATAHGLLVFPECIARYERARGRPLLAELVAGEPITVPESELFDFVTEVAQLPDAPDLDWPPELALEQRAPVPVPHLVVKAPPRRLAPDLEARLSFAYDGHFVAQDKPGSAIVLREQRCILQRQRAQEAAAVQRLHTLGLREVATWSADLKHYPIPPQDLPRIVATLCADGWQVDAEGKHYRTAARIEVTVSSGIDWFELNGHAHFGAEQRGLPQLLAALRRGEKFVVLDDGTFGVLPEQWLERFAAVAQLGHVHTESAGIRFTHAQTALLDALLATLPEPRVDETFQHMRTELARFDRISAVDTVASFTGTLRPYQREGLGWLNFLRQFSLGGCLADDMGLGKTVQVLALLEQQRCQKAGPTLIVVPRSLVFNWKEEAARFAPALRVRDYTGLQRRQNALDPSEFDVLLTTYGTLRRDAPALREIDFDTIVLDEAQAIKNAKTGAAKAARLLRGRNRLALSGTPIENRLEELWSLFDFLNPGMLGASSAFSALRRDTQHEHGNSNGKALLARALRPVLLRRTKEQVAPELPPRVEQTLLVELEPAQRALYNELREHYRNALLPRVDRLGVKRVQIEILEALLRLRQAACHPALIDPQRAHEDSAKLDVLTEQLGEVVAEGHKALVFSQFTSFLSLVRARLDASGLVYEYLDGKTRNRQERVQRFQTDAQCPLFLISLRAGGFGLNLTAADYVFVLDPWWNPAVEAQAIDRTHRIGQQRSVFAVRLIARDTVEEKVLELQRHKRALSDAILEADASGLAGIGREELELLLG
jgi:superfamily II DNA or RNA helicase